MNSKLELTELTDALKELLAASDWEPSEPMTREANARLAAAQGKAQNALLHVEGRREVKTPVLGEWLANCRGLDEYGTPLVAVYGSEHCNAVDRANLVGAVPEMFEALSAIASDAGFGTLPIELRKRVNYALSRAQGTIRAIV